MACKFVHKRKRRRPAAFLAAGAAAFVPLSGRIGLCPVECTKSPLGPSAIFGINMYCINKHLKIICMHKQHTRRRY